MRIINAGDNLRINYGTTKINYELSPSIVYKNLDNEFFEYEIDTADFDQHNKTLNTVDRITTEDIDDFIIKDIHVFIRKDYNLSSQEIDELYNSLTQSREILFGFFQKSLPQILIHKLEEEEYADVVLNNEEANEKILQILALRPPDDIVDILQDFSQKELEDLININIPFEYKILSGIRTTKSHINYSSFRQFRENVQATNSTIVVVTGKPASTFVRAYDNVVGDPLLAAILGGIISSVLLKKQIQKKLKLTKNKRH